jgi:hypothetical protein
MTSSRGLFHYQILRHLVDHGFAPSIEHLAATRNESREAVIARLKNLQRNHGVVLHPRTSEVWVIHPFSTAPTSFWVETERGSWWGNCAWCSLGIVALMGEDATITTTLGGESTQVRLTISGGTLSGQGRVVHFPIPMKNAWSNVILTCSTILVFDSSSSVHDWCQRHGMPQGDIQPLENIWSLARAWYARHLDPHWSKLTADEAHSLFERFGLTGPIWEVSGGDSPF